MRIDPMNPSDAAAVSDLFRRTVEGLDYYSEEARKCEIAYHSPEALLESIGGDPESVLVATDGAGPAGFCMSKVDDGVIWLDWFGVDPRARGRRLGAALLERLESTIVPRGCHKVWCDCRTTNEPSKKILTAAGYSQLCVVTKHWYGLDFILWEKPVP